MGAISLKDNEVADLKESFEAFDRNQDGTISRSELRTLMHTVGHKVNAKGLEDLLTEYDVDKSGNIDFKEFLELTSRLIDHRVKSAV